MAVGPSAWLINSLWDAVFEGIPFVVNAVYVQLHTGDPGTGGLSNVLAVDRQPAVFTRDTDGHWVTTGAPLQFEIDTTDDVTVTHISLHNALDDGDWLINMIANKPIPLVEGDVLIASDNIAWTVEGWVA